MTGRDPSRSHSFNGEDTEKLRLDKHRQKNRQREKEGVGVAQTVLKRLIFFYADQSERVLRDSESEYRLGPWPD
jgi:hypothetical protein